MTALTMIFGLLPLMVAHGVGAHGSRSLASTAVGTNARPHVAFFGQWPAMWQARTSILRCRLNRTR